MRLWSVLLLLFACWAYPARSQSFPPDIVQSPLYPDLVKAAGAQGAVDFENEHVRVVRIHLNGESRIPTHEAHSGTVVCISECHVRFLRPDGKSVEVHQNASGTHWVFGDVFSLVNLTDRRTELLLVESKPADWRAARR